MLSWSDFHGNAEAHLRYVQALLFSGRIDTGGAIEELRQHLHCSDARDWAQAPRLWLQILRMISIEGGDTRVLLKEVFDVITAREAVEDSHAAVLFDLELELLNDEQHDVVEQLIDWFVHAGGPGDAALALRLLEYGLVGQRPTDEDDRARSFQAISLPDYFAPLVTWILEKGSAMLRQPDRAHLLPALVDLVHKDLREADGASATRLELALRYVARSPRARAVFAPEREHGIWPAIEAALRVGCADTVAV